MAATRQPAGRGLFESAVVVPNDTDLVVPVRMVTGELERPVSVVCQKRTQVASQLRNAATHVRNILASELHSFSTLMHALATRCRHQCRLRDDADGPAVERLTEPTPLQQGALELIRAFPGDDNSNS